MQVEEIKIDATEIRFFDDYVVEEERASVEKLLDITVMNAVKNLIDAE